jgi:protein TonB
MKLTPLRIGFGASFIIHVVAFGAVAWFEVTRHPPALNQEDSPAVLTIIAAPLEPEILPASPVSRPAAVAIPPEPETVPTPPSTPVAPSKPIEATVPTETVKAIVPVAPTPPAPPRTQPVQLASAESRHEVPGDGSSKTPGSDLITSEAHVSVPVKARPNYLKNPEPIYPAAARRRHQEGTVLLKVKVTAAGQTASVTVEHSSGFSLLDEAAERAVREWEFQPAKVGSQPVDSEIEVPIRFQLAD